ncbi:MAG: GAF domain-containing sensor histidine kinase [Myxococcales bacterium]|nr:GAF domain-containing sensor histidine kinase [Myxococcales bacterium]
MDEPPPGPAQNVSAGAQPARPTEAAPTKAQRLSQRADELRVLDAASTALNSVLERDAILDAVLGSMGELYSARHCSVFLASSQSDPAQERTSQSDPAQEPRADTRCGPRTGAASAHGDHGLSLAAARGERVRQARARLRFGEGIIGTAAAKREIVRLNFKPNALPGDHRTEIESHMAIPMQAKGELVGVVYVETLDRNLLRKDDERLVTVIANHAAVALQNAALYAHLRGLNEALETRVQQRTAALEATNRMLRDTQAQLVQSGKLAALGELAAGLSHEMNTPLGAINAGVDVTGRVIGLLGEFLDDGAVPTEARRRLERALTAMEATGKASRSACDRVFSIFKTLRSFAKLDQADLQHTSLHEGLDTTVTLLSHRLGTHINVQRHYGDLPDVRCFAGEVNQAFLIVLTNAIDATTDRGTITVATRLDSGGAVPTAVVEIADNGAGIERSHLDRVFDPGFTTKGVGVGTGLSLGIAYRIMEKHGGSIEIDSTPGQGTTVCLRLPVHGP